MSSIFDILIFFSLANKALISSSVGLYSKVAWVESAMSLVNQLNLVSLHLSKHLGTYYFEWTS